LLGKAPRQLKGSTALPKISSRDLQVHQNSCMYYWKFSWRH